MRGARLITPKLHRAQCQPTVKEGEEELPTKQAEEVYAVNAAFIDSRSDRERQA
jgi:hypothetical protein